MKQLEPISGANYLLRGFSLLMAPGLRLYVLIPMLINLLLFSALIAVSVHYYGELLTWVDSLLPSWLHWLNWLLWIVFAFTCLLVLTYTFTIVANIVASPFNSFLSSKVELLYSGKEPGADDGWRELLTDIPRTLKREWIKLWYYLPRALGLLIIFFIPVVNIVAAVCWFLFNAWMMSIQYVDYPADNHRLPFPELKQMLSQRKSLSFSFGSLTMLLTLIPVVNFVVIPAAVIGATLMWMDLKE